MSDQRFLYRQRQTNITTKMARWVIYLFIVIGLCSRFIANDLPLVAKYDSSICSPVILELLSDIGIIEDKIYTESKYTWKVMPLIPYSSDQLNSTTNVNIGPLDNQESTSWRYRHWLGTDQLGRDVFAGLIHGTSVALKVGLLSVFFSLLMGLYIGLLSGYYGDDGWRISLYSLILGALIKLLGLYYIIFPLVIQPTTLYYFLVILVVSALLILTIRYIPSTIKSVHIPIDLITTKIIEVLKSIPTLFIILALLSVFSKPSIWNVIFIISVIGWPKFARLIRAEILQIKNLEYIQSAKSIGLTDIEIIIKHALPNALTSIISITAFAISGAILLESTLSFLGLGIPLEQISWGSMLADSRENFSSWWLAVFPGMAIFMVLLSFYIVSNQLNEKMNIRQ